MQYAIVFKTPAYHNPNIDKQKYVQVQLKRRTDGDVSDPKPFTYFPKEHGKFNCNLRSEQHFKPK